MRSLTEVESRVLGVLLADEPGGERSRLQGAGLARSTYHAARRRAYQEGWVRDRYVPSPTLFGFPEVTISLARPFADRSRALAQSWADVPGNVVLWAGARLALGVFFHRSAAERDRAAENLRSREMATGSVQLHPRIEELGIPVYFDFEGAWSNLIGAPGVRTYPRALPPFPVSLRAGSANPWTPRTVWAAGELLGRPFRAGADGGGHLVGPFGIPSAQKRLIADGWVYHRVLADPARLPEYAERPADRVVFVTGNRRVGVAPETLFATLTRECQVFPFLFAYDERRVVLGSLGRGNPGTADPSPGSLPRRSVMPTLRLALEEIEIFDEPASALDLVTDHRYDRLAPGAVPVTTSSQP